MIGPQVQSTMVRIPESRLVRTRLHVIGIAFETLGNPGWNWTEFLKYLKKASSRLVYHLPTKIEFREQSETLTSPPSSDCDKYHIKPEDGTHGRDGPVAKTFPRWITELHVPFFTTLESLGVPINPDPVGVSADVIGHVELTTWPVMIYCAAKWQRRG